jgi:hypothetical protein
MNRAKQWRVEAMELRRQLADKPTDSDLIARANELAREGHRLGVFRRFPRGCNATLSRDPASLNMRRKR